VLAGGGDGGQAHPAALGVDLAGGCGPGLLQQAEQLAGVAGEHPPGRRERQPPALAHHQRDAQLPLEGGHRGRDGGLAHEQPFDHRPRTGPAVTTAT
jgi:hypothetical protein